MSVVVGIDGSEGSIKALRWALDEARRRATALRVVHAWGMPYGPAMAGYVPVPEPPLYDAAREGAQEVLDHALAAIDPDGVEVEPLLVEGNPVAALLEAAGEDGLIVVGSRGRGGFAGLLLGSVGQQLVHHAHRPVVIVPK